MTYIINIIFICTCKLIGTWICILNNAIFYKMLKWHSSRRWLNDPLSFLFFSPRLLVLGYTFNESTWYEIGIIPKFLHIVSFNPYKHVKDLPSLPFTDNNKYRKWVIPPKETQWYPVELGYELESVVSSAQMIVNSNLWLLAQKVTVFIAKIECHAIWYTVSKLKICLSTRA